jgi:hypothetical protein
MLNLSQRYCIFVFISVYFFFITFKKLIKSNSSYDILFFLIINLLFVGLLFVFFNMENYLGFIILSETSAIFLITIFFLKERFVFSKNNYIFLIIIIAHPFLNLNIYSNFFIFNFYKHTQTNSDLFKLFYKICIFDLSFVVILYVVVFNFFIFFFFKQRGFFFNFNTFFKTNFIFKNRSFFFLKKSGFIYKTTI